MADTSMADEQQSKETVDGQDRLVVEAINVIQKSLIYVGKRTLAVGPNREWSVNYDSDTTDAYAEDPNDEEIYRLPANRAVFPFARMPQVPEYDAISDVPPPDPDGPYSSEPADPRGIVRFTQTAAGNESALDAAGLYSYSIAEGAWMRLDVPPP